MPKKASAKKPLNKTEYCDEIQAYLVKEYGYDEEDFSRKDVKNCLEACVEVAIQHCKEGLMIPNLGKLILYHRKASKARMGRNPATGEEIKIGPKPAKWTPKFRLNKYCKDACSDLAPAVKTKSKKKKK